MAAILPLLEQLWHDLQQSVTLFNSFIFSLIFFFIYIIFLHKFFTIKGHKLNLPPSPPKLPIIGNLHQLGTLPHRSLLELSKKYGPVMLMQLGYTPAVVITSAEVAKDMTKNHDIVCSDRPKTTASEILFYGGKEIIMAPYGEHWRQARKVCVNKLLSLQRVQSFQSIREEEVKFIIERIRFLCDNGAISINLTEMLMAISSNIICRCVLGKRSEKEDGKDRFGELTRRFTVDFVSFSFGDYFPCLGWLDVFTGLITRLKDLFKEWDSYFDQVIEEHKILKNMNHDFVDILLQLESDDLLDFDLTQDKLKAILLDMIAAGSETTSTTTEWIMAELVRNPTILKKAQEEVRRVVGEKSKVDETDISQMSYLKCVVKEALRLHSPAPLMVPRETSASVKLGGYDIPPKTRLLVNTWAIQRDSQLWGDKAEEFIPERFENNPIDFKGQDFEFLPFGAGRRGCPGILFGVVSVEYTIANLLYWFNWTLPEGITPKNLDMSEVFGQTTPKQVPLQLVPTLYSP